MSNVGTADLYSENAQKRITDAELHSAIVQIVQAEIAMKESLGLPIARYDAKNKTAFIERPSKKVGE